MSYFYCLKHHAVEGEEGCRAKDRLGPYDTEDEADAVGDVRSGLACGARIIGVGSELDQVAQSKGREHLAYGGRELAHAAEPELAEEGLVHSPQQRVLLPGRHAPLEGRAHGGRQGFYAAPGINQVDVVGLQRALVSSLLSCKRARP